MAARRTTLAAADCDIVAVVAKRLRCLVSVDADGVDKGAARESLDVYALPATALAPHSGELVTVRDLDDPRLTDRERPRQAGMELPQRGVRRTGVPHTVIGLIDVLDTRPREYTTHRDCLQSLGRVASAIVEKAMRA